ncbi:MAG: L,D-transpeptidase family protein [Vampirovibrionales bacterium]|nr:L,D-transpeptidase family protein [Vampirovibrionales bacterium]
MSRLMPPFNLKKISAVAALLLLQPIFMPSLQAGITFAAEPANLNASSARGLTRETALIQVFPAESVIAGPSSKASVNPAAGAVKGQNPAAKDTPALRRTSLVPAMASPAFEPSAAEPASNPPQEVGKNIALLPSPLPAQTPEEAAKTLKQVTRSLDEGLKIVIYPVARKLQLQHKGVAIKTFPVGVGRAAFLTPAGQYKIIRKLEDPAWENPYLGQGQQRIAAGAENPLGTRWMGFKQTKSGEYGIHGTDNPASVGKFSSHGCVRMRSADAELLYDQVTEGTPVEVSYSSIWLEPWGERLMLTVFPKLLPGQYNPEPNAVRAAILKKYPLAKLNEPQLARVIAGRLGKPEAVGVLPN